MQKYLELILTQEFGKRACPMTYGPNTLNNSVPKGPMSKPERQLYLESTDLDTLSVSLRAGQEHII